ncbi:MULTISPECIES: DUF1488 domain-containing protein [unclassified Shewanella]|uniref:DUF1488 domain-containing protein n=1 Tax=unclassified Shewanella TaxID=196818 RepID=UPI001BBE329A|nr:MULTISPECIES: DUF1488 domain-containing protein [unclassified Shewanella]GIU17324.1 transcriptional regulator [Shewanella sp. MBTL60-112-B1]GIU36417.1 transcriptional regulator [Shewanella sp. MBTL60-112-B2]
MNQSILFPDLQDWDSQTQSVVFPVQVQGANIECLISLNRLTQLSSVVFEQNNDGLEAKALAVFEEYRFDIEEEVEMLIEQELFDEQGRVVLI